MDGAFNVFFRLQANHAENDLLETGQHGGQERRASMAVQNGRLVRYGLKLA